jgi:mono/diheme cytochrome c family protein
MRAVPVTENRKGVSWSTGLRHAPVGIVLILGLGCSFFVRPAPLFAQADVQRQQRRGNASASEMRTHATSLPNRCARCHNADGTGKSARDNFTEIPDFTNHRWQASRSDAQLRASILDGKGSHMPAFRDKISDKEVREMVAQIRGLGPAAPTGLTDGSLDDFDRRYRELHLELQELKKQFKDLSAPPPKP